MHEVAMPVRWGDMDATSTSITRCTSATGAVLSGMVCRLASTVGVIVPILVEANCRFIRAVTHPATVRVTIR